MNVPVHIRIEAEDSAVDIGSSINAKRLCSSIPDDEIVICISTKRTPIVEIGSSRICPVGTKEAGWNTQLGSKGKNMLKGEIF